MSIYDLADSTGRQEVSHRAFQRHIVSRRIKSCQCVSIARCKKVDPVAGTPWSWTLTTKLTARLGPEVLVGILPF